MKWRRINWKFWIVTWRGFAAEAALSSISAKMIPPINQTLDDKDLDDEALWAVIDSAVASSSSATKSLKAVPPRNSNHRFHSPKLKFPIISKFTSSSPSSSSKPPRNHLITDGEVLQEESYTPQRPQKIARLCLSEATSPPAPLAMVKHVQRTPTTPASSCSEYQIQSPVNSSADCSVMTHSLSGRFPTVALFKEYQNAAMAVGTYYDHVHLFLLITSSFVYIFSWIFHPI